MEIIALSQWEGEDPPQYGSGGWELCQDLLAVRRGVIVRDVSSDDPVMAGSDQQLGLLDPGRPIPPRDCVLAVMQPEPWCEHPPDEVLLRRLHDPVAEDAPQIAARLLLAVERSRPRRLLQQLSALAIISSLGG